MRNRVYLRELALSRNTSDVDDVAEFDRLMRDAFGAHPWRLGPSDVQALRSMAMVASPRPVWRDLAYLADKLETIGGEVEIFREYVESAC
jgi:hypothetical protein